jgi:hypothetical protein
MITKRLSVRAVILAVLAVWVATSSGARASCLHAPTPQGQALSVVSVRAIQALDKERMTRCATPCRDCAPDQRSGCCASALLAAADATTSAPRGDRDRLWSGADHRASQSVAPPYRPPNVPSTS